MTGPSPSLGASRSKIGHLTVPKEPNEMAGPSCSGEPPPNTDDPTGVVSTAFCVSEKGKGAHPVEDTVPKLNGDGLDLSVAGTPKDVGTKG